MAQQTAVEWLVEQLPLSTTSNGEFIVMIPQSTYHTFVMKAKQMEKEQHQTSFNKGYDRRNYIHDFEYGGVEYWEEEPKEFEQYYNETYGSNDGIENN